MGVTGLWSVVAPTARPTKLETLNRKRLAVDASIWIYQFLKAVRDKEGNALRNSHVVGFFRRICKLLYFGILPVFVFDGGAPGLKRETIQKRRRRREGRREDAAKTAGKLLAVQVARAAEDEDRRRKESRRKDDEDVFIEGEDLVYVDEIGMSKQERQKERATQFKKKDQYHLPDMDNSLAAMGAPNDPRIMSQAELEEYARQFHSGEDINLYDFSKIDFESPFFLSLPAGDRYNILNAARLRSRLRMGYSKEQLDGMFPDRMAFSRFQIERVKERNELTQRLMHINGMNEEWDQGGRIAGEKGKEYILVKNEGVEGGWALGVVSNKQGTKRDDAIDVDAEEQSETDDRDDDELDEFEDVAIEGLNRLPKSMKRARKDLREVDYDVSYEQAAEEIAQKRKAVYEARRKKVEVHIRVQEVARLEIDDNPPRKNEELFVAQDNDNLDDVFEDVPMEEMPDDDEGLQRAIAISLGKTEPDAGGILHEANALEEVDASSDDESDLAAALARSRRSKKESSAKVLRVSPPPPMIPTHNFSGPLPFESLNLGQSLLGKKKADKMEQDLSGGFDRDAGEDAFRKPTKAQPAPTWFNTSSGADFQPYDTDDVDEHITYGREDVDGRETLIRHATKEVIDLEAEGSGKDGDSPDEIYYAGDQDDLPSAEVDVGAEAEVTQNEAKGDEDTSDQEKAARAREQRYELAREIAAENEVEPNPSPVLTGDVVEYIQSNPLAPEDLPHLAANFEPPARIEILPPPGSEGLSEDEMVDWSESDCEDRTGSILAKNRQTPNPSQESNLEDEDDEAFEDVDMPAITKPASPSPPPQADDALLLVEEQHKSMLEPESNTVQAENIEDYLSESEEELMRQLALEAEGHAEFASELNQMKTPAQAARDYENELKQLRNQQKKDRRDADEVTQVMIQECQALLRLFGLPYITAPMEAEAQCAELVHLGLVDGIVTDDSDIFLFGGTRIYKNMFNAAKFVECYVAQDLEKEYALDRKKLIRFAHLLGSDYTEGIPGIGPVTALDIITDFSDLDEFKEWCTRVQIGRPQDLGDQLTTAFRRKFKKTVQKKVFLPPIFPDLRVDYAYLNPEVDSNPEDFQWGIPDLDKLRGFLMATIGWSQERTDEILVPVIRDMNKREQEGTQANITRFFSGGAGVGAVAVEGTAPRNRTGKESGRMKNAYARLRGEARKKRFQADDDDIADNEEDGKLDAADLESSTTKRKSSTTPASQIEEDAIAGGKRLRTKKPKT